MDEEELQQLLANSQGGIGARGWGGAAGAAASVQNRPTLPKPGDHVGSNLSFLDWLAGTYENRSYKEGILQGWFNPQYYRKQYEDMSVTERFVFDQEWIARQDPGAYFFNKVKKLAGFPVNLLPDSPQGTPYNVDNPPSIEDVLQPNAKGDPIQVLPPHEGYPEPSPGNPHKDKPFNFFDWLNENLPPPGPAPEPPEMYKPPHWTEGLGEKDERGMYKENVRGPQNWRRDGVEQRGELDYYNLTQDLIGEGSIAPYTGEQTDYEAYNAWVRSNVPTIHADQEKQYQQAVDENQRWLDEQVADIMEAERLRQKEYDAEKQRYTDKYNENPYFYDNLLSGGGSSEWDPLSPFPSDETYSTEMDRHPGQEGSKGLDDFWTALGAVGPLLSNVGLPGDYIHRLDPSVGQPIIPVDPPISQEEIILNQTRPGGGIGLSEQIINQSKPSAYSYPGMLN
tara:strand:+ start:78 stop:1433 length:1356 start_codon:yes stop_codon:yes gene_type:complete